MRLWLGFMNGPLCAGMALALLAGGAHAQDLEPRAYSAIPVGGNFVAAGFSHTGGSVSLDPSVPIKGVQANIDVASLSYVRSFNLLGRAATIAFVIPEMHGVVTGQVIGADTSVSRTGLGDVRARFAVNLLGDPALTPAEFAKRQPTTTLGTSLTLIAPTGQYDSKYLINLGSNRWAVKPEIGLAQPFGRWFADASIGVWIFGDNSNYFGGHTRDQQPISTFQVHGGYNFRPRLWIAADATYYRGGQTELDHVAAKDSQSTTRYGLTLSVPIADGLSAKVAASSWLSSRIGGKFQTIGITLQYAWF